MTVFMKVKKMIEDVIEYGNLYDFYGNLLNDSQKKVIEMYYIEDLSLSEIGSELGISRQAAYDSLKRAERNLRKNEDKLHLYSRFKDNNKNFKFISEKLKELEKLGKLNINQKKLLDEINLLIDQIVNSD